MHSKYRNRHRIIFYFVPNPHLKRALIYHVSTRDTRTISEVKVVAKLTVRVLKIRVGGCNNRKIVGPIITYVRRVARLFVRERQRRSTASVRALGIVMSASLTACQYYYKPLQPIRCQFTVQTDLSSYKVPLARYSIFFDSSRFDREVFCRERGRASFSLLVIRFVLFLFFRIIQ